MLIVSEVVAAVFFLGALSTGYMSQHSFDHWNEKSGYKPAPSGKRESRRYVNSMRSLMPNDLVKRIELLERISVVCAGLAILIFGWGQTTFKTSH